MGEQNSDHRRAVFGRLWTHLACREAMVRCCALPGELIENLAGGAGRRQQLIDDLGRRCSAPASGSACRSHPGMLERADLVVCDSRAQCPRPGELHRALGQSINVAITNLSETTSGAQLWRTAPAPTDHGLRPHRHRHPGHRNRAGCMSKVWHQGLRGDPKELCSRRRRP